ncbi:hypothetical protein FACS1894208_03450 [Clostridia bacterium]|nr:hypothetical protein FACS1894208_03450 [Clostridia bacterium]
MNGIKRDNSGFSLLELLVSITILAVLSLMLVQFLSVGVNFYRRQQQELSLQTNSQIVISVLSEYVQDCTKYPTMTSLVNNDSFEVENSAVSAADMAFVWDGSDELKMNDGSDHLLMKGVTGFFANQDPDKKSMQVTFTLNVLGAEKTYTTVIYMRNWRSFI